MKNLKNKTVILTGAGGGIGRALTQLFLREGANLALVDLNIDNIPLKNEHSFIKLYKCDVTNLIEVERLFTLIQKDFQTVDILINNAGITHRSLLKHTKAEVINKVIAVSLNGTVNMTTTFLPAIEDANGLVVGMSSVAGFAPLIGRAGYCAAKHGVTGFLRTLRTEGINTLIIHPSFIDSGMDNHALAADGSVLKSKKPLAGRAISPASAASQIIKAIKNNKKEIRVGFTAKLAWYAFKCIPFLYRRQMIKKAGSEFE